MKVTLFLGAGFSVPFGHPTMDSFLAFADSCPRLTKEDRSFLGTLVLEARRANSFLESSPTNLEDILSFAEMGDRLRLGKDEDSNQNERLRVIIQKIYTNLSPTKDYWGQYLKLEDFLGCSPNKAKGSISFITTNYDLNIESACLSLRSGVNPGFPIERINTLGISTVGNCYDPNGVPVYKLHGSVNWYMLIEQGDDASYYLKSIYEISSVDVKQLDILVQSSD